MPSKKLIVGLTGGIGSGKSEASRCFITRGVTVVDADIVAREVVEPGTFALGKIRERFGDEILLPGKEAHQRSLNRSKLREIIFSAPQEKKWLEELLHPLVNQKIRARLANASSPYAILASPLLLETQQYLLVDRVLVIDVCESMQIERASQRDVNNEAQIRAIMHTQLSRQERCSKANDIILNHGSLVELDEQVEKLHQMYLQRSLSN